MLNQKQILSNQPPVAGQVWYDESSQNYYRIDAVSGDLVQVRRLAYEYDDKVKLGRVDDIYCWRVNTFKLKNFRVVATNLTRFESWLNRVVK